MTSTPPAAPVGSGGIHRTNWAAVFTFALATLVIASESTMAAFALPLIGTDLGVSTTATAWVLLAYSLPLAALAIPLGRWVEDADLRTVFCTSLLAVGALSVLMAATPSFWLLIGLRALEGVAAAAYLAAYLPVVAATVQVQQRGRAMSYVTTIMTLGSMAVTPLGGLVAGTFGWRAVFLAKLPLLVVGVLLGRHTIPGGQATGLRRLPAPDRGLLVNAGLVGGAVAAVLLAADQVEVRWPVAALLLVAAVVLTWWWTRLPTGHLVVDLVRLPRFGLATLSLLLLCVFTGLTSFSLPYFVAEVLGAGPETLALATLCFTAAGAVTAPVAGALTDRFGAVPVAATGTGLLGFALAGMATLGADAGLADLAWRMAAIGATAGLCSSPTMTAILDATPAGRAGTAGGVSNVARTVGTALGPALAALAWSLGAGGVAGFRAGVVTMVAVTLAGCLTLVLTRAQRPATG